jgi:hypothetical protein
MTYTEAHKRAMKKWREKNADTYREKTRSDMAKHRAKWREYTMEAKRLSAIDFD